MIFLNACGGSLLNEAGNFIKRSKESDSVSYIPKSKYKEDINSINKYFNIEAGRVNIKIGRFVNKFLTKHSIRDFGVKPSDVEAFVNLFKSYFTPDKNSIKVIEGEEILKWYDERNYALSCDFRTGSLWNSCMRQSDRNKFMSLYAKNPDKVKMLLFLTEDDKVRTRALLWQDAKDNKGNSYKVMDRVYSIYEHDVYLFKSWAKENGYISKLEQSARCENMFDINGSPDSINCYVELPNHELEYYPYLDTFKYYDPRSGKFSNSPESIHIYKLVQSSGGLEPREIVEEPDEEYYDEEYNGGDWSLDID